MSHVCSFPPFQLPIDRPDASTNALAVHEDTWHGAGPGDAQKNVLHLVELAFHNYGSHITAPPPKKLAFTMAFTMAVILPHLLQKKMEQWSDFKQLFHC